MHKKASPACELRKDGRASQATSDGDSDAEDESDADSDGNLRGLVVKDDEASSSDPETSEDESIEASARPWTGGKAPLRPSLGGKIPVGGKAPRRSGGKMPLRPVHAGGKMPCYPEGDSEEGEEQGIPPSND